MGQTLLPLFFLFFYFVLAVGMGGKIYSFFLLQNQWGQVHAVHMTKHFIQILTFFFFDMENLILKKRSQLNDSNKFILRIIFFLILGYSWVDSKIINKF